MRNRYEVISPWGGESKHGSLYVQSADIRDKVNGRTYAAGAYRVVDARKGMKPAKVGKGGTVPFYGECAWMDAERLANDLALQEAYGR